MCGFISLGAIETGIDVEIPITVTVADEGQTGVVDSDIGLTLRSPSGVVTQPAFTLTEVDSANAAGAYVVVLDDALFNEIGPWGVYLLVDAGGTLDAIHCAVRVEIVNKQWPRFGPDFDSLFRRAESFFTREGVNP